MRSRSVRRSPMAMRSESTAARSSRSLAVSGQVPRATSTVNTSTATPFSPLTLAARTFMPLRASAPATEEKSPRRSGAATMTCGGSRDTDGNPVWRTSSMSSWFAARIGSGPVGSVSPWSTRSRALDQVGHEARLPRSPRRRTGGPAVGLGQRGRAGAGSPGCRRLGPRGRWWSGRRGRAGSPCRAAAGGGAPGRPAPRRRRARTPCVSRCRRPPPCPPRCGRRGTPCRCRAGACRSAAGPVVRRGRSGRRRSAAASSRCRSTV